MIRSLAASLSSGAAYALFGVCIVLVYRMTGTLNFALTAIGALSAFTMLTLVEGGAAVVSASVVAVALGGAVGALMGTVFASWFRDSERLTRSTVTIAILLGLLATGFRIFGDKPRAARPFFPGRFEELGGVRITYDTIMAVVFALAITAAASLVLHRTRVGVRLRAMAEDSTTAELAGVPVGVLTVAVWGVSGSIAAVGAILVGTEQASRVRPLGVPPVAGARGGTRGPLLAGLAHVGDRVRHRLRGDVLRAVLRHQPLPGRDPVLVHPGAAALAASQRGLG